MCDAFLKVIRCARVRANVRERARQGRSSDQGRVSYSIQAGEGAVDARFTAQAST
jgi:hypothetical protein